MSRTLINTKLHSNVFGVAADCLSDYYSFNIVSSNPKIAGNWSFILLSWVVSQLLRLLESVTEASQLSQTVMAIMSLLERIYVYCPKSTLMSTKMSTLFSNIPYSSLSKWLYSEPLQPFLHVPKYIYAAPWHAIDKLVSLPRQFFRMALFIRSFSFLPLEFSQYPFCSFGNNSWLLNTYPYLEEYPCEQISGRGNQLVCNFLKLFIWLFLHDEYCGVLLSSM